MHTPLTLRSPSPRRRYGALVLLVLILGVAAAPVADAWAHGVGGSGGTVHGWGDDCGLCRVVATAVLESEGPPSIDRLNPAVVLAARAVAGDRAPTAVVLGYEPPARAPPV